MEISVSLGTKFSHVLFHPLSSSFPTTAVSNSASAAATARVVVKEQTHTEPAQQLPPAAAAAARGKRQSSSYLARKSAILEVQQSSDLTSSLESSLSGCNNMARLVFLLIAVISSSLGKAAIPLRL
ncbi:hypothetical protein AB3S75_013070 [Citrus x aurantiifolia]